MPARRHAHRLLAFAALALCMLTARTAHAQRPPQGDPSETPPLGTRPGDDLHPHTGAQPPPPPPDTTGHPPLLGAGGDTAGGCAGPRVLRVRFQGLQRVSDQDIRSSVHSRAGSCFSRADLQRDAHSLWDLGFFSDVQIAVDPSDQGGVIATFQVAERPSIHAIRYDRSSGSDSVEEDKIHDAVDLREGSVVSESAIRRNVQNVRDLYAERGYFLAEIRSEVVPREGNDNEADVVFHIRENAQVQVRAIQFVGNNNITADELRGVMQTQQSSILSFITQGGTYREEAFRNDIDLLHAAYYDRGYLNVSIENPRVALSPDRRYLDITIYVREGPRYRVGHVEVREVNEDGTRREPLNGQGRVNRFFRLAEGDWFSRSTIGRDIQGLQNYYRDAGYASVEVTPDIQPRVAEHAVDLALEIHRGQLTYVHRVVIRGNQKTADRVIRRELRIYEGDRYSESAYQASKNRVQAMGYFERVDLSTEPVPDHPDQIIVNVEVTERPTGTFQVGAGFSSIESFIATAQIQQLNLFGRGQALTLQAQVSSLRQIFSLRFVEPYLFDSLWTGAIDVYNTLRVYPEFARSATGGSLSLGYPLIGTNDLRLAVTYTGEEVGVNTSINASAYYGGLFGGGSSYTSFFQRLPLANLLSHGFTSAIGVAMTVDTRNDRLFPTSGIYARLGVDVADPYTASQNVYTRWSGFFRFYVPLFAGVVFKANLTGGLVTSRDPKGVPIFERYYLGGILDVRGFFLRSIGPRLPLNSALDPNSAIAGLGPNIGGNLEAYYNIEVEFPILQQVGVRGVIFTDGGNVWNTESLLCNAAGGAYQDPSTRVINPCVHDPLAIRTSWGFGIRWFSPLGLLRFEWGFPFVRLPGEQPSVFEFTIGNFF